MFTAMQPVQCPTYTNHHPALSYLLSEKVEKHLPNGRRGQGIVHPVSLCNRLTVEPGESFEVYQLSFSARYSFWKSFFWLYLPTQGEFTWKSCKFKKWCMLSNIFYWRGTKALINMFNIFSCSLKKIPAWETETKKRAILQTFNSWMILLQNLSFGQFYHPLDILNWSELVMCTDWFRRK